MRIAVTSSDGKNVNVHFGTAWDFLIFDVDDDKMEQKETWSSLPWCGEDADAKFDDDAIEKAASVITDREVVVTSVIRECAYDDLTGDGILSFESNDSIENAIKAYVNYPNIARGNVEEHPNEWYCWTY